MFEMHTFDFYTKVSYTLILQRMCVRWCAYVARTCVRICWCRLYIFAVSHHDSSAVQILLK